MARLSVIFGFRKWDKNSQNVKRILECLDRQTFRDFKIIMIEDIWWTWASKVRNEWIKQADTELVQLFDDDNWFNDNFLETAIKHYDDLKKKLATEIIVCWSVEYRETGKVWIQGFSHFSYWQSRPILKFLKTDEKMQEVQMFNGNWILGRTDFFKSVQFDEQIARIAEDIDWTLSLSKRGARIFAFGDLVVRHYERDKTILENARIGSYSQAKQKARNWILFVYKHWTSRNKVQFWLIWVPWCLVWLWIKALRFWWKNKYQIIKGLLDGLKQGLWERKK